MTRTENGALLREYRNGARMYGNDFWQQPWYVRDVPCQACGRRHTVRLNESADTAFSWPGRAYCRRKTCRGFIRAYAPALGGEYDDSKEGGEFIPFARP